MQKYIEVLNTIKHLFLVMKSMMPSIEGIALNAASMAWIILDVALDKLGQIPTWVTVLIGVSIAFLNIAKGISVLRNKKKPKE